MKSSLIQPDLVDAYPPSEELDRLIKVFYDKLIKKVEEERPAYFRFNKRNYTSTALH